ncbi:MCP four helix bundle domain-containing protein, partial [Escherichia coli]|uniref:MCP four helix bundle domain-containing protein n=1 Tax=Escherichia coli TaxID=562 RepID=UPI0012C63980
MKWFNNLKISTKLISCFIMMAVITGIVGLVGIFSLQNVNSKSNDMFYSNFIPSQDLQTIQTALQEVRANHLLAIYEGNPDKFQARYDTINNLVQQTNDLLENYETIQKDKQEEVLYQNVLKSLAVYR